MSSSSLLPIVECKVAEEQDILRSWKLSMAKKIKTTKVPVKRPRGGWSPLALSMVDHPANAHLLPAGVVPDLARLAAELRKL